MARFLLKHSLCAVVFQFKNLALVNVAYRICNVNNSLYRRSNFNKPLHISHHTYPNFRRSIKLRNFR
jgi:hypothetical protein